MQFGFETVIWGRRIYGLEVALDQIAACGYKGVEFSQSPSDLLIRDTSSVRGWRCVKSVADLIRLLKERGLELISLAGGPIEERIKFCEGAPLPYLYLGEWNEEIRSLLDNSTTPVLGLHPHWLLGIDRLAKVREILAANPSLKLGLLPDTAHLMIAGDDPVAAIQEFRKRLVAVHLKDWIPSFGRFSHRYAHGFVTLGRGIVPLSEVLNELKGWEGWVIIEQDSAQLTPARSAWECAQWLMSAQWMTSRPTPSDKLLSADSREDSVARRGVVARAQECDFIKALSRATSQPLWGFYKTVVDALQLHLNCPGVSLWSHNAAREELQRVGAAGVTGAAATDLLPCKGSLLEEVVKTQRPVYRYLQEGESSAFVGEELSQHPIDLLAIPVFNYRNAYHLRYVLVVIWPAGRRTSMWPTLSKEGRAMIPPELEHVEASGLTTLVESIDRTADLLRDEICSSVVGYTSWLCSHARSRDELLQRFVHHIRRTFQCEGVALFLENEATQLLEGACSEPETCWRDDIPVHQRGYSRKQGVMGNVWASGEMRFTATDCVEPDGEQRSWEIPFDVGRHDALCFPMATSDKRVLGVIRCTNKTLSSGTVATKVFTDDDAAILDAIVQTALPHLEVLMEQEAQLEAIARQIHETKMPIIALRGAHEWLRHLMGHLTAEQQVTLDDLWQWTEMLNLCLDNARLLRPGRSVLNVKAELCEFTRDVVEPVLKHARLLLGDEERAKAQITQEIDLPPLNLDKGQWMQIVFNLLSNACKYRGNAPLGFQITAKREDGNFVIQFRDNGVGVAEGMNEVIFRPGFRAPSAVRSHVTGQGIGLAVVHSIVTAHGGTVHLTQRRGPTIFEIQLPVSLASQALLT